MKYNVQLSVYLPVTFFHSATLVAFQPVKGVTNLNLDCVDFTNNTRKENVLL